MLVLQETPAGFALFKVDDAKLKKADTEVRYVDGGGERCVTAAAPLHAAPG